MTRFSILARALVAGAWFLAAAPAMAQQGQAQQPTIGFVDFDRVFSESKAGRESRQALDAEVNKINAELDRLTQQARSLQDEINRNAPTLSASERTQRERELVALNARFEQIKVTSGEDYEAHRQEAVNGMLRLIQRSVEKVAQEGRYDAVINRVVVVSPSADITEKVIRTLDADASSR